MNINKKETKEFLFILLIPLIFLLVMWIVKLVEIQFNLSFVKFGIYPKDINSLSGILFSPFIHKDFSHLFNNSYPKKPINKSVFFVLFLNLFFKKFLIFLLFKIIFFEKSVYNLKPFLDL